MNADLSALVASLLAEGALAKKRDIQAASAVFPHLGHCLFLPEGTTPVRNGDDAAAIQEGDGYLLLAAEGMLGDFVEGDPFFAGFCAVMVNANDIFAMGGRPYAVVNVLFSGDSARDAQLLLGMREGASRFGVPVVGGHLGPSDSSDSALAVAIVGRARRLITSFDAQPGDRLLVAVQLAGRYRPSTNYFDGVSGVDGAALRAQGLVLSSLAEDGLVRSGKDVSMASFAGTLVMLCETSELGAVMDLDRLPRPEQVSLSRWLNTFPSFAFLLAVAEKQVEEVRARFASVGVTCENVGLFTEGTEVRLMSEGTSATLWDHGETSLTGFGATRTLGT